MRRTMALMAALMFILSPRVFCLSVIQTAHVVALVDDAGTEILSGAGIERIYTVRANALYAAGQIGDYRLYDAEGHLLNEARCSMIADSGGTLIYRRDGLYGAMDDDGANRIDPIWTQLVPTGDGAFLALRGDVLDDVADEVLLLTQKGDVRATGIEVMNGLNPMSEARMPYTSADGHCGYLDAAGRAVIPATWNYAGSFQDGVANVSDGAGCMLIDALGNALLPTSYDWMRRGDGFVAAWTKDGCVDVYTPDGQYLVYTLDGVQRIGVVGRYVSAQVGDEARLYDAEGNCIFAEAGNVMFLPGLADEVVVVNGAWGEPCQRLIDGSGATLTQKRQGILPLCAGRYAYMTVSGAEYYSGDLESLQTSWDYDSVRYGLMDDAGRELLPARYREIRAAGDHRLLLIDDAGTTLADVDGHAIRVWLAEDAIAIGE